VTFDAAKLRLELAWLKKHPEFRERPATLLEFLGPEYLNIEKGVREKIKEVLADIIGHKVLADRPTAFPKALITGGIGIGKTTIASIVLPYLCHWVLCLKDPQDFFHLLPGSRIAFMQMSTSEDQAKEVVFGDIKARIAYSPWFRDNAVIDPNFKNQIRFEGDIWILPGDSSETTFEGYNILGGIVDEMDSHKVVAPSGERQGRDYAQAGYDTIHARITSRFKEKGFVLLIGQKKKSEGFAARMQREYEQDPNAYVATMTIWESLGWDQFMKWEGVERVRDSFWYDIKRKQIVPSGIAEELKTENLIEVPMVYHQDFKNNPEKALRDLAGIPPAVGDPFISLVHKIEDARDRWLERHEGLTTPIRPDGRIEDWFRARDSLRRCVHIDIGYSAKGDAAGLTMGHVREVVEIDGEKKPYIVIDCMMRWRAMPGQEIMIADLRHMVYYLKDELGFRIRKVTYDGFESQDSIQQLRKRRYEAERVSMDKSLLPYYDLRDALYEDRIEFPKFMVYINPGDAQLVEIAYKELSELEDQGKKIDHPSTGSKDVADSLAGVTYTLMGDRTYRRNVLSIDSAPSRQQGNGGPIPYSRVGDGAGLNLPAVGSLPPLAAPPAPTHLPGLPELPPRLR
jgi:hypothetical protein